MLNLKALTIHHRLYLVKEILFSSSSVAEVSSNINPPKKTGFRDQCTGGVSARSRDGSLRTAAPFQPQGISIS
jgi:hypothetical protein